MPRPDFSPYRPRPIDSPTAVPIEPGADLTELDEAKVFAAPNDPSQWPAWREALTRWRSEASERVGYDRGRYAAEPSRAARIMCLAWLWDELLYDHESGRFTVDRYVDDLVDRFGHVDGVTLWNAYPVLGIDERNHFDFFADVPDLPEVVADFQRRGLSVYLTYYPWETGSKPEAIDTVVSLAAWLKVDGVFLDSSKEASEALRGALDSIDPGLTLEGESRVPLRRISAQTMSWAQWFADSPIPGVLRAKWFERRHELHHTRRWNRSHLDELHSSWLNGTGILIWEVVFGVWVGWNDHDRQILRAMSDVFSTHAEWFTSEDWVPLADYPGDGDVFASRWTHDGSPLWTVVNRGDGIDGAWIVVDEKDAHGSRWHDLVTGKQLNASRVPDGRLAVGGHLASGGVAAVLRIDEGAMPAQVGVVAIEAPLVDPTAFPARAAVRRPPRFRASTVVPHGMSALEATRRDLTVHYRLRETGLYGEAPFVDEWKPLPPRLHRMATLARAVEVGPFAIDVLEVTNAQFLEFVQSTAYRPVRSERFLAHWVDGAPRQGSEQDPVTHIALEDARAYAQWRGRRLPTEDEWQLAAEAGMLERGRPLVWNLTESEHNDGRTRFHIIKGGCEPHEHVSDWYVESGPLDPRRSVKLLQLGAGLNRSPSIGFRCAVDLERVPLDVGDSTPDATSAVGLSARLFV